MRMSVLAGITSLMLTAPAAAQLFDSHDVIQLEIEAPLRALTADRYDNPYRPAQLRYYDDNGAVVSLPIEIRTRGKTRRRADICAFPPLRIRFGNAADTIFSGQPSLKLVTHCQNRDGYDQHVLQEYLAYRVYNQLTTRSFNVRLVSVSYLEGERVAATRYAFFIEDWRTVADRNSLTANTIDGGINIATLSVSDMNRVALFQYLIGNDDWSALWPEPDENCCHNMRPLITPDERVVPLPYDFDFARIVNVPYAMENGIFANVVSRSYGGLCATQSELAAALDQFRERRSLIYAVYESEPLLVSRQRRFAISALDRFFDVINNPNLVERRMTSKCQLD